MAFGPVLRFALAAILAVAPMGLALAQESSSGAVEAEGSVVEGASGGLDVGRGALWLGVTAALGLALGHSIADDDSNTATGATGALGAPAARQAPAAPTDVARRRATAPRAAPLPGLRGGRRRRRWR